MRVLLLGNVSLYNKSDFGWGGIETTLKAFRKYLAEAGHEPRLVHLVLVPKGLEKEVELRDPDAIYLTGIHPLKNLWPALYAKKELMKVIRDFKPDVIWSRNIQLGLMAAEGSGCPVLQIFPELAHIAFHWDFSKNILPPSEGGDGIKSRMVWNYRRIRRLPRFLFERWLEKKAVRKLGKVVFSRNMREQIEKVYQVPDNAVNLVHPGVDENIFNPKRGRGQFAEIGKKFGLKEDEKFVLFVGRFVTGKNIPLLLKAMAVTMSGKRLVIVGDGPLRAELESHARDIGLSSRVIFTGRQDELLAGFYTMAGVFANPCLVEPFGHVFIESLSCGTPVIGIQSDGSRTITALEEVTDGNKYGRAVEPAPEALAKAIEELTSLEEGRYRSMSDEGMRFVRANYNWPKFIETMIRLKVSL